MRITTLVDQQKEEEEGFVPEFGLSFLLQEGEETFLFDAGAGEALAPNLARLGIDPASVKKVILSHGHCDHTGGLRRLSPDEVWCCRGIDSGHYSRHADGGVHDLTMPADARMVLNRATIHWVGDFQPVSETLFLTGPIPRVTGEGCGGDFFLDEACVLCDTVAEEQALLSRSGVLVTGCCHAGIVNTLLYCQKKHPEIRIHAVAGGLHLRHAGEERLRETAAFFRRNGIRELHLLHCTGENAVAFLRNALPECVIDAPHLGQKISVGVY